jgi:hypothetical protein
MMNKAYLGYGAIILTALSYAQYRGLSLSDVDEVKGVPKTVRDNPGAYRAHYAAYSRYSGGK